MNTKKFLKTTCKFSQEDREYIKNVLKDFENTGATTTLDKYGFRILVSRGNTTKAKKAISKHGRKISSLGILVRVYDKEAFEGQWNA